MDSLFDEVYSKDLLQKIQKRAVVFEKRSKCVFSSLFLKTYNIKLLRPIIRTLLERFEIGIEFSETLRRILKEQYNVTAGRYSRGASLKPGILPPGTIIGPFACIAANVNIFRRNHPIDRISSHPLFFNPTRKLIDNDTVDNVSDNPLVIGAESWIGMNVTITANCRKIGIGAVIGTGAVVTSDVPDFAVVAGNPAKLIKMRFDDEIGDLFLSSRWWDYRLDQLIPVLPLLSSKATIESIQELNNYLCDIVPK